MLRYIIRNNSFEDERYTRGVPSPAAVDGGADGGGVERVGIYTKNGLLSNKKIISIKIEQNVKGLGNDIKIKHIIPFHKK